MNDVESQLLEDFNSLKSDLNEWGRQVDTIIMSILENPFVKNNKVKIPPKYRLKEDKSFLSKALL